MKKRALSLLLALCLLPFNAFALDAPQAIRTDFTYFYISVEITDQTTGEIHGTLIEGDTIEGDEESPQAIAIRQDLIRQADAYATALLRPGTELADRATSADLKWSHSNEYTVEDEHGNRTAHEDVYSSYYIIYSASIVPDGTVRIDAVNISVDSGGMNAAGTIDPANNYPTAAALDEDAPYSFDRYAWTTGTDLDAAPFSGAVSANTDYYARIQLSAKDRAVFSENLTIRANGVSPARVYRIDDRTILIFVKYHISDSPIDDPGQWGGDPDPSHSNPFLDIDENSYYYAPVLWAVDRGVTNGTSDTTFSPTMDCTRAQVVTFLWRAAGEPVPGSTETPFTDVAPDQYCSAAVAWAVEQNITRGTSDTTFSPKRSCSRAQIVTFLWRASGEPKAANPENPFSDVSSGKFYTDAVLWAVENRVTRGTSPTAFSPNQTCTRAEIVTFLFRAMA